MKKKARSEVVGASEDMNKDWESVRASKWALSYIKFFVVPSLGDDQKVTAHAAQQSHREPDLRPLVSSKHGKQ